MPHYSLKLWTDYVRGVCSSSEQEAMSKHLDSGCERCAGDRDAMQHVLTFATRDASLDVPEAEVTHVKQLALLQQPQGVYLGVRGACELLFDSFRQPFALGVRNAAQTARQLLYSGDGYCVDVHQTLTPGAGSAALIGQATRSEGSRKQVAGAVVTLRSGHEILARAVTNQWGEFEVEHNLGARYRIQVSMPGKRSPKVKKSR